MLDPIALWGALTGTAGLGITARREVINRRQSIRVDHGWQYKYEKETPDKLQGMVVYVMVTNTGARDIAVTHVGWEWLQEFDVEDDPVLEKEPGLKDIPEGVTKLAVSRAEIPVEGPVLLHPDGVSARFFIEIGQMLHLIDPFDWGLRAMAYTHGGGKQWLGTPTQLVPEERIPLALRGKPIEEGLKRLKDEAEPPTKTPTPFMWALEPAEAELGGAKPL